MSNEELRLLKEISSKLDVLLRQADDGGVRHDTTAERELYHAVSSLTPRQHATMQMLMAGHTNQRIAEVFGVSINTVKVHVRTVCKKFRVKSRGQLSAKAVLGISLMSDEDYENISGGLPKNWATNFIDDPRYEGIIR